MALLKLDKLSAFYGKAQALHAIDIEVNKGEIIAVIGANGAGKSTMLDSIMGMTDTTGSMQYDGEEISGMSSQAIVSKGIGYGSERFNLFPYLSVYDNLMAGAFTARDNIKENLQHVYALFPRLAERSAQETSNMSGGERQMVSLGRAMMTNPNLLMVDEPTIGLAPKLCGEIAIALRRMRDELGLTIIITEQNAQFALTLAERVYVLESGRVKVSGTVDELRSDPKLTAAYFGHQGH
jgi:branched-chain amino acid transport system ATP-binding protein